MKTIFYSIALLLSCGTPTSTDQHPADLPDIWLQGKAEIYTYKLIQNRYQDLHPGEAVMIFVSEPWNAIQQVKSDIGSTSRYNVLKNNQIRRFTTGIYDYSIFTSAFTNGDGGMEKVTASSQDWCGQSWLQYNVNNARIEIQQRSYFEQEGDRVVDIRAEGDKADGIFSEDNIYNRIRLGKDLPTGSISMLPASHYVSLRHIDLRAYEARCAIDSSVLDIIQYTIYYPDLSRTLAIQITNDEYKTILGWTDTYPSAFDGQSRSTTALLDTTIWTKYWNLNGVDNTEDRLNLGLGGFSD